MAISNTTTITPLMMATSVSMETIPGLDVNPELNSTVLVYEQATHLPASILGGNVMDGTLTSDGDDVYAQLFVSNVFAGTETQTFTEPDGSFTTGRTRPIRNYLGKLSSLVPGGWVFNGNLYQGSLSAFGGQVADRISSGYLGPTMLAENTSNTSNLFGGFSSRRVVQRTPSYDGKYVLFYGDPTKQTLGADTIPALTQTVPSSVTGISGSLTYWMDQAISRPLGKTKVTDQGYLTRTLGIAQGFVSRSNRYLQATRNSESYSLNDLGYTSYQELISQGWLKYQQGQAIKLALSNIGAMITASIVGLFGTPAGVAFVLINQGLGDIGGLITKLTAQDVVLNDLGNTVYSTRISKVLSEITDPATLDLIQEGVGSSIPNMTSALDYISIEKCAGIDNDSVFASFADVGTDLMTKTMYLSVEKGSDLVPVIEGIQSPYSTTVESQAGTDSLLKPEITNLFRGRLPVSQTDTNITLLDVIGSPCGYYQTQLDAVNQGIQELDNSSWGPQVRLALQKIVSAVSAVLPFTDLGYLPDSEFVDTQTEYTNQAALADAVDEYNQLMNQIINDPAMATVVEKINSNYLYVAQRIALETQNRAMAKNLGNIFSDGFDTMDFATSLHSYAVDSQGQGTGTYVSGLVQNNATGDLIRATMAEGYNYNLIGTVNIAPNGFVA